MKVSFSQERHSSGWIDLFLVVNNEVNQHLKASIAFPPFRELIHFLENILENNLPSFFVWDEEGELKRFSANLFQDGNLFNFVLEEPFHLSGFPKKIYLEGVFEKKTFVDEFYKKFTHFLTTNYNKEEWVFRYEEEDLMKIDLSKIQELLERAL